MKSMAEIISSHEVLDAKGNHCNGTDRHGPNHQYGDAYESLFPDRDELRLVMEIGTADGAGMLAWREAFPNATIVGLDIHHCEKAHGDRLEFYLGDQRSKEDCERAAAGRQFDFICEDATHELANNLLTLFWLWPFVKSGGIYVIEEFANVNAYRANIAALFPQAKIVETVGPSGGSEPLVVLRKP